MNTHYTFHHELTRLNQKILQLSTMVEERVRKAAEVIQTKDEEAIKSLILLDYEVDEMEVEIEEDCLKILALHQPVARDLRFLIAVIKINNEMERIADIAVSIAMRVQNITKFHHLAAVSYDFSEMSGRVLDMLKKSIDSLVKRDSKTARDIFLADDAVDQLRNRCYEDIKERIRRDPEHPGYHINTYLLARHLERISDRAVNIAEEVIYFVEGTITRFP
ncbi:phosphate transport system regulatory protein PhoU [Desulfomarina profundi]|uniref:Phosphate-specific transport system accessory protein PhoU n=1 Tax=Desulfomarina profundi TaxID=2772557 RepID=A0A8D5FE14_9BACT|nr:phosphate signaling complex protein PhoU [Desulfomarina profundi]BCL59862.1 phosphate transport system regulatory protein PhoU [Desulfomarina profundi]